MVFVAILCIPPMLFGQKYKSEQDDKRTGLEIHTSYLMGLPQKEIDLNNSTYHNNLAHGLESRICFNTWFIKSTYVISGSIGYKYLVQTGEGVNIKYSANSNRLVLGIAVRYSIRSSSYLSLGATIENNMDFEDFRSQTNDLFRYTIEGNFQGKLTGKLFYKLGYSAAIYPINQVYTIFNPQHQLNMGLAFKIY